MSQFQELQTLFFVEANANDINADTVCPQAPKFML